jgi:hypothetical protein
MGKGSRGVTGGGDDGSEIRERASLVFSPPSLCSALSYHPLHI